VATVSLCSRPTHSCIGSLIRSRLSLLRGSTTAPNGNQILPLDEAHAHAFGRPSPEAVSATTDFRTAAGYPGRNTGAVVVYDVPTTLWDRLPGGDPTLAEKLFLLIQIYRRLRAFDELDQTSDFTLDLKTMAETIGALYSLKQAMYIDGTRSNEVELLLQQVVPLVGRVNLLQRTIHGSDFGEGTRLNRGHLGGGGLRTRC
jgi:hypothetical protein